VAAPDLRQRDLFEECGSMAFQFLCPQGHLLEGDESHMGMTTRCPHCGMTFIIPTIEVQQAEPEPEPEPQVDVYSQPYVPEPVIETAPEPDAPFDDELPGSSLLDELPQDELLESSAANIVHIPCPNGHELETPLDMIGQEVLCPHCGVQFRLRNEDSVEYRHELDKVLSRRARIWFNWAIAAAVCVFILLSAMMVYVVNSD